MHKYLFTESPIPPVNAGQYFAREVSKLSVLLDDRIGTHNSHYINGTGQLRLMSSIKLQREVLIVELNSAVPIIGNFGQWPIEVIVGKRKKDDGICFCRVFGLDTAD